MDNNTDESGTIDFCRLCLRIIIDGKISFQDTYVLTIVKNFFPRLNIRLFEEPFACKICLEDLISAFKVQKLISNKLESSSSNKDSDHSNLCFLCLTPQKAKKVPQKNNEVRSTLDHLFKNLRVNIKPTLKKTLQICVTCTDIAKGIIGSLEHLLKTDSKISSYCKKNKLTNIEKEELHKIHKYVNGLNDSQLLSNNDVEILRNCFDLNVEKGDQVKPQQGQQTTDQSLKEEEEEEEDETVQEPPEINENSDPIEENDIIIVLKYNGEEQIVKAFKVKNTHFQSCPVCLKVCSRLAGHMKNHHPKGFQGIFFRCPLCPYQTKNKGDLRAGHALVHKSTDSAIYKCDKCSYKAKRKAHLDRHMLVVHCQNSIKETFQCTECPYQTKIYAYLRTHTKIHESPDPQTVMHKCPQCLYQTTRRKHLSRHMNIHKDKAELDMLKCALCDYETFDKHHLKSHVRCRHTSADEVTWYKCDYCSYKTKYKSYISHHVTMLHTNQKSLPLLRCLQCPYTTRQKGYLRNHIAYSHQQAQPFRCPHCPFVSKCKSYYNKHVKAEHQKVSMPKLKCPKCPYETLVRQRLARHESGHSTGRRHQCGTCGATYKYRGDYVRHLRDQGHKRD